MEHKTTLNLVYYYVLLLISLGLIYLLPWSELPYSARLIGILLTVGYSIPVFFAGVIFSESFRRTAAKSDALGANIFGAVAGGALQNLSFIFGLKALILVSAVVYAGSGLCLLKPAGQSKRVLHSAN